MSSQFFVIFLVVFITKNPVSSTVVRLINSKPKECLLDDDLRIFLLRNDSYLYEFHHHDRQKIRKAPLVKGLPVKVIISGLVPLSIDTVLNTIGHAYITQNKNNVIFISYGKIRLLCDPPVDLVNFAMCMYSAVKIIFDVLHILPEQTHMIGVSLGAVFAAYIAQLFENRKFKRITALEPVEMFTEDPCISLSPYQPYPLSRQTATFVDVYHTNSYTLGKGGIQGHVDVIFNNGITQIECDVVDIPPANVFTGGECNHVIVCDYFAESIHSEVGFWAQPCQYSFDPYTDDEREFCTIRQEETMEVLVGEHISDKTRGLYRVDTYPSYPRAIGKIFS